MRSPALAALVDDAAFLSHEAKLHLLDLHGEDARWGVDLAAGTFSFEGGATPATYPVQLLGSAAPGPRSWLWGWANPSGYSEGVLRAANAARALGQAYGIPELTSGEVPFDADDAAHGNEPGMALSADLARACAVASGTWFTYCGAVAGGTRVWMLLEGLTLPPATFPRVARLLPEVLQTGIVTDHRRAVTSYATLRDLPWDGATLRLPDGEITLTFDDLGRVSGIRGSSGPATS